MLSLENLKADFDQYFDAEAASHFSGSSPINQAAMYSLMGAGKRIRPLLILSASYLVQGDLKMAQAWAMAMEMIHSYSLIHDDLPAMDNDDLRRGRATNHKVYGEALAILAGDALLTESMVFLNHQVKKLSFPLTQFLEMQTILYHSAGVRGMILGQALDMQDLQISVVEDLEKMHRLKTGELISASLVLGGMTQTQLGQQDEVILLLRKLGEKIGLAFQVADDCLDESQTSENLGKTAGKDRQQGKSTYVSLLGLEKAQKYARQLMDEAQKILNQLPSTHRAPLEQLINLLVNRTR